MSASPTGGPATRHATGTQGPPRCPSPAPRRCAARCRRNAADTVAELAVRRAVHARGLRYRVDRAPIKGLRRRADLVFGPAKVAVYVDGCFWHACPHHGTWPKHNEAWWRKKLLRNVARDRDTDSRLHGMGWVVVRVWEHEEPDVAAERIVAVVTGRRHARQAPK